jgi:hypothetical protein
MPDAVNPLKPWQHAKASFFIAWRRLSGGALEANPWGTYVTLKYVYGTFLRDPDPPDAGSLEVSRSEPDTEGFALYGMVRVSGVNVIPPC